MPKVYYGRKDEPSSDLELSDDRIAVRTRSRRSILRSAGSVPLPASDELADATMVAAYPEAGVEAFRVPVGSGKRSLEDRNTALKTAPDVPFSGGSLIDTQSRETVLSAAKLCR